MKLNLLKTLNFKDLELLEADGLNYAKYKRRFNSLVKIINKEVEFYKKIVDDKSYTSDFKRYKAEYILILKKALKKAIKAQKGMSHKDRPK